MKRLIHIAIIILVLGSCFGSMLGAGYSWYQACGFDFILLLLWLVILFVVKLGQLVKGLRDWEDARDT
jgi:hypothetical protein